MKRVVIQPNTTTVKVYSVGLQGPPGATGATGPSGSGGSSDLVNLNTFTGSADTRLINLEAVTSSYLTEVPSGTVSSSAQIDYNSILNTPSGIVSQSSGTVDLPGTKIQYSNVYSNIEDLPAASSYHGMFAHVHGTGKAYYAHGGNWIELANASSNISSSAQIEAVITDTYISASAAASGFSSVGGGSTDISALNTFTGSASSRLDDLEAATGSYLTEVPSGTVSSSAQIEVVITDTYISASAAASGFGSGGGGSTDISDLNTFTGSASSRLDDLEAATSSFLTSSDTGSLLVTASVVSNVITLEKADGTSFDLTVETGSGGGDASNSNRSGALFDNIPVNELINDTWTFNTTNRKILPNTSGKFTTATNQITIAASSSANNFYYTELSASKAGDGLVISDNVDKMRYTINSFSILSNTFENFTTTSLAPYYPPSQLQSGVFPSIVDLSDIEKVLVITGSSPSTAYTVVHYTSSNPVDPAEVVNSNYGLGIFGFTTHVSGGYFAAGSSGGGKMKLRNSLGTSVDDFYSSATFVQPMAVGFSGSGDYLLFSSKFNSSPNANSFITIMDTASDPSQFGNAYVSEWNGYSGMTYGPNNYAMRNSLDAIWDQSTKCFYHLLWSGDRTHASMSIAEVTSSFSNPNGDAPFKTSTVRFSDPGHGENGDPWQGKTMAGSLNKKLWVYNRGDEGRSYTSSIIEFDYSSGMSTGVYSEVISLSQTSAGESTWGYPNGAVVSNYVWAVGGLMYSPTNNVLIVGAYNKTADASVTYVYDASSYILLQTINDVMLTGNSTMTETGTIITYDIDGFVKVLTPSSGDSEKFVYNVSYYNNDPSIEIDATSGDVIYTKLQLKDPVATSPNGNKWRLTIDNNGVVTGSAI